ncbi:MAG: GHKL domain-containing protein [Deltaproteobacteria bacterium]|nr:GHKL domain-containing protein [Deltaproteobacteria bacterium]
MPSRYHINIKPEIKPFRLVKYFAVTSFIVLIAVSFPFVLFISQGAKDILTKDYFEDYRNMIGENLNNQFWNYFAMPVANVYGQIELGNESQQKLLDETIKFAIRGSNIELVKLHSPLDGMVVYSTDPKFFKEKTVETPEYKKAVNGESSSFLITEGKDLWGEIGKIGGEKKVRAYIPVTQWVASDEEENETDNEDNEPIVIGVFEVTLDMTEQYNSILKLQYFIFGVSFFIMVLIFFALLFIVHNAEEIIQKRAAEQKALEEQLHLAERLAALGQMVAGVSHEIKNPLGIIQSTAELLAGMNQADERQKRLSLVIKEESIRLNNVVAEFLDFARPYELNIQECRLDEIIRKNISFLSQELDKKGIKVKDNFEGRELKIHADPERLYRVFMNLILNSIQAIEESGEIRIMIHEEKDVYLIVLEDTGTGIEKETMKKIFNPFFTTKEKGSGLGLSIVRNIIEGHEGTISIESDDGAGARVIIRLPRRK